MYYVFVVLIVLVSVSVHEFSHGLTAYLFGDDTAKNQGRLSLNPLVHIDPIGTVILPLVLVILDAGIIFGYARPVPINPYNFKKVKLGKVITALAGPLSNIVFALVLSFLFILIKAISPSVAYSKGSIMFFTELITVNIILATFNLMPFPPLDGFWIVTGFLPDSVQDTLFVIHKYLTIAFFAILMFAPQIIKPIYNFILSAILKVIPVNLI